MKPGGIWWSNGDVMIGRLASVGRLVGDVVVVVDNDDCAGDADDNVVVLGSGSTWRFQAEMAARSTLLAVVFLAKLMVAVDVLVLLELPVLLPLLLPLADVVLPFAVCGVLRKKDIGDENAP